MPQLIHDDFLLTSTLARQLHQEVAAHLPIIDYHCHLDVFEQLACRLPDGNLSPRGHNVFHHTPQKRFGEPGDLLGCVRWLLDDEQSAFVTGITVPVDGGFTASSGV